MEDIRQSTVLNQFCKIHKRNRFVCVNLSPTSSNPLMCSTCLAQNRGKDLFASVQQILEVDTKQPISNWPPIMETEIYKILLQKQTSMIKEKMFFGITTFYDTLRSEISQILRDSEKQQLILLEKAKLGSDEVINFYNTTFKKQELIDIFKNPPFFDQQKYQNLLNYILENEKKDFEVLMQKIQESKDIEKRFRFCQEVNIEDLINEIIKKINDLSHYVFKPPKIEKGDDIVQFENYESKQYMTLSEYEDEIEDLKNEQIILKQNINRLQNKSALVFQEQTLFYINYESQEEANLINISNPSKSSGTLTSFSKQQFSDEISFTIKFNTLLALQNFDIKLKINFVPERILSLRGLLDNIQNYLQISKNNILLELSVNIKNKNIEIGAEGIKQKKDFSKLIREEIWYQLSFKFERDCEGFQICNYKEISRD